MSNRRIIEDFLAWRQSGRELVLATVWETAGSTYSKAGHRIILDTDGQHAGLVSGGCLEADLALHAAAVANSGSARTVSYDLRDDDELFGLGIGCAGLLRILLQPLRPATDYQPFGFIAEAMLAGRAGSTLTVTQSTDPAVPVGATLAKSGHEVLSWQLSPALQETLAQVTGKNPAGTELHQLSTAGGSLTVLHTAWHALPRLLILGAGPDAVPLVNLAVELGWQVTLYDHRATNLADGRFARADAVACLRPGDEPCIPDAARHTAAIVMTHQLQADRDWLRLLAATKIPYLGLLGPLERRQRLLADLGPVGEALAARLHGPAGLAIGGRSPEAIALSILAQIQALLSDAESGGVT